jgi:hypothetical protein
MTSTLARPDPTLDLATVPLRARCEEGTIVDDQNAGMGGRPVPPAARSIGDGAVSGRGPQTGVDTASLADTACPLIEWG